MQSKYFSFLFSLYLPEGYLKFNRWGFAEIAAALVVQNNLLRVLPPLLSIHRFTTLLRILNYYQPNLFSSSLTSQTG